MIVGRHRILSSATFLGLALLITGGSVRAQDDGKPSHQLWNSTLSPDQLKAALGAVGGGELDKLRQMVKERMLRDHPGSDPKQLDDIINNLTGDEKLMNQLKEMAKQRAKDSDRSNSLTSEDLAKLLKTPPGELPKLPTTKDTVPPPAQAKAPPEKLDLPKTDLPRPKDNPVRIDDPRIDMPREANDSRTKSLQAIMDLWERTIGPLDKTPEVQKALTELFSGENGLDFDMTDEKGNSLWDLLRNGDGSGTSFEELLNAANWEGDSNWNLPKFRFPKWGKWFDSGNSSFWSSNPNAPRSSSGSSGSGSGGFSFDGLGNAWLPIVIVALVILGVFLRFRWKSSAADSDAAAAGGYALGKWPLDPRRIDSREDVVLAFEYLSVSLCGPSARTWTHGTIGEVLAGLAATHGESAIGLARLYELARYAPRNEPLSRDELIEARGLVCNLAGVAY